MHNYVDPWVAVWMARICRAGTLLVSVAATSSSSSRTHGRVGVWETLMYGCYVSPSGIVAVQRSPNSACIACTIAAGVAVRGVTAPCKRT